VHLGVTGTVPLGSVGPKIVTIGNPTAPATCIAPESFPMNSEQRESSAGKSAVLVFPVKSIGLFFNPAIIAFETATSIAVPNRTTSTSLFSVRRFSVSANRSGGQHFAEPYEAPAPTAIRILPDRTPAATSTSSAARRFSSATSSEIQSTA